MVGKQLIATVVGAALSVCLFSAQAAVTEISTFMDDYNVSVEAEVGPGNGSFDTDVAYPGDNPWTVTLTTGPVPGESASLLKITGQHNIEPCFNLVMAGTLFDVQFAIWFGGNYPSVTPPIHSFGVLHNPLGHIDMWSASVYAYDSGQGNQKLYKADITGQHIPEPHQYALVAGLGLLAFGFYRRVRG